MTVISSSLFVIFLALKDSFTNSTNYSIASFFIREAVMIGFFSSSKLLRRMTTLLCKVNKG